MSYTAPDFAEDVQSTLTRVGYSVIEEGDAFYVRFAGKPNIKIGPYPGESNAWFGAFSDMMFWAGMLQYSAARVIGRWESGDLAEAVRLLQEDLGHSLSRPISELIAENP